MTDAVHAAGVLAIGLAACLAVVLGMAWLGTRSSDRWDCEDYCAGRMVARLSSDPELLCECITRPAE